MKICFFPLKSFSFHNIFGLTYSTFTPFSLKYWHDFIEYTPVDSTTIVFGLVFSIFLLSFSSFL